MAHLTAFARAYSAALREDLTIEATKIKLMRDLARENPSEAPNVLAVLAHHIRTCPPVQRLPAVYLLDALIKSAGPPYPDLLAPILPEVFSTVWDQAAPDLRAKLSKTAGTWGPFVPAATMSAVQAKMQPSHMHSYVRGQSPPMYATVHAPPHQYHQPHVHPVMFYPPAQTVSPQILYPAHPPPQPAHAYAGQYPQQPPAVLPNSVPSSSQIAALLSKTLHSVAASGVLTGRHSSPGYSTPTPPPQAAVDTDVEALLLASSRTRGKFLDLQFLRNKRRQGDSHSVRPWFVSVDDWLTGTRPSSETVAHFADEPQDAAQQAAGSGVRASSLLVEEDPSQPACAISGEVFERTYDPDTDKWYYEDAVSLSHEQAASLGLMHGSIVKAQALAGGPHAVSGQPATAQQQGPALHTARPQQPDVAELRTDVRYSTDGKRSYSGTSHVHDTVDGKRARLMPAPAAAHA